MALCEHLRSRSQRNGIATEVLPRPAFEIHIAAIAASLSAGEETRIGHLQPVADVQRAGLSRLGTSAKETGIQTYEE